MIKKKLILILTTLLLIVTLTACNTESSINEAKGEAVEMNIKSTNEMSGEERNTDEENRAKQIAIEEIKYYFDVDIDNTYEIKVNYYDYGDDSRYHQYLFWNDSNTFDIRISEKKDRAFYLKQILPESNEDNLLNREEAEMLSVDFINSKLGDLACNLVLTNTDYEVEKNSSDIEYYVFQYNEKDNENSGVFIKVDCYNKYITEITLFN